MDIRSGGKGPAKSLSNFAPHPFTFRGIPISSMEGFLQGLKFEDPAVQAEVFKLVGSMAKNRGRPKNWQVTQTLYFQGEPFPRNSEKYTKLLNEAYWALFTQNASARRALLATGNAVLTHSIGRRKKTETVLTKREFCSILMDIRDELRQQPIPTR